MTNQHSDWDYYYSTIEDQPAAIELDLGLASIAPLSSHPWILWFSVKYMEPDANGFAPEKELPAIEAMETALVEQMEGRGAMLVGRVKGGGMQDMYFYASSEEGYDGVVLDIMNQYPDYLFNTDALEDPDWEEYMDILYPDPYNFQSIQNRRLVEELSEQGDDLTKERPVDHWLSFENEAGRDAFLAWAIDEGFNVLSLKKDDEDEEYPEVVNIVRNDIAELDRVNEFVWELNETAVEYGGTYDGWGCEKAE